MSQNTCGERKFKKSENNQGFILLTGQHFLYPSGPHCSKGGLPSPLDESLRRTSCKLLSTGKRLVSQIVLSALGTTGQLPSCPAITLFYVLFHKTKRYPQKQEVLTYNTTFTLIINTIHKQSTASRTLGKNSLYLHSILYNFFSFSAQDACPTPCYDRKKNNEKASGKPSMKFLQSDLDLEKSYYMVWSKS